MPEDYRNWIASTDERRTYLHRCFRDSVDRILREGLSSWHEDLSGTATSQPRDIQEAEQLYRNFKDFGDSVIVIHFPRTLYDANNRKGANLTKRALAYFHPVRKEFTVRPEFVVAWIDRKTDEVHLNPYEDRRPAEGHEKFDYMFD